MGVGLISGVVTMASLSGGRRAVSLADTLENLSHFAARRCWREFSPLPNSSHHDRSSGCRRRLATKRSTLHCPLSATVDYAPSINSSTTQHSGPLLPCSAQSLGTCVQRRQLSSALIDEQWRAAQSCTERVTRQSYPYCCSCSAWDRRLRWRRSRSNRSALASRS